MKRPSLLLIAASLLITALAPLPCRAARAPRVGDAVADFSFVDFSGAHHRLSDFAGRYVLLDFWATWCKPCLAEVPELKRAREEFRARGLMILGMNSDRKAEAAHRFVQQNQLPWLQSSAPSTKYLIRHVLKVKWYPTLVLLSPRRIILAVSTGTKPPLYGSALFETLGKMLPPVH